VDTPIEVKFLQSLLTGLLIGSLMSQHNVLLRVEPAFDDNGNYLPWFFVTGVNSQARLKISVEVEGEAT
jgi:hypothetical protein